MNEIERAHSALNFLDPGCQREEWVRIGIAAKAAGLTLVDFHFWSKNADNYKDEMDCRSAWKSFDETGEITARTLYYIASKKGWSVTSNSHSKETNATFKTEQKPNQHVNQTVNAYADEIWMRCVPATLDEEYISRKHGKPDGLRVYPSDGPPLIICQQNMAGYLVIPCVSNEHLQTLQFIPPNNGDKLNLPRASFNDGYFTIGKILDRAYIVEGIGQAWAINNASQHGAIVCFGAGRMKKVALTLRKKHPNTRLILIPDRGKEKLAQDIAIATSIQWVELPQNKPDNYDANDYALEYGNEKLASLLEHLKVPEMRYKLLSGTELLNAPSMRWIVHGVLPAEGLTALYGPSGSGKSFLILDMALAIAGGHVKWFNHHIIQSPVTYVCLEGEAGMGKRIKAWHKHFQKPLPDALRFIIQPFNLMSDDISELAKTIMMANGNSGLVILDTLNRAASGADENSSVDMGNIISASKHLQSLLGGVVLLVHHTGKNTAKGLRGHSSLYAALDGAIEVAKTDTRREWSVAKSKDDATGDIHPFKLEVVPLDFDERGDAITSCVALFDDSKDTSIKKKQSLGRNQKIALAEIEKQLLNSSHINKEDSPALSKCLNFDEAVSLVAERIPTDLKHQKSRAKEAIARLVEIHYLGMKGNWLWKL
jgi:putative DNA primase/helicase